MTTVQENLVKAVEDRMEEMGLPRHHAFHHGLLTEWFVNDGMVMVARKGFSTTPLYHSDVKMSEVMAEFRSLTLWKS